MQSFDLVLIGTGAGEKVAWEALKAGMKVAIIDEGPFGGTCVNRGCIPSKMLIRSADVHELVDRAHLWGVNAEVRSIDWQKIVSEVAETVDGYSAGDLRRAQETENETAFTVPRSLHRREDSGRGRRGGPRRHRCHRRRQPSLRPGHRRASRARPS